MLGKTSIKLKNENRTKSIVFVADNNYILQFLVTLQSLLDNNNENFTIFLITCELSEENKQHLTKWENNNFTKSTYYKSIPVN